MVGGIDVRKKRVFMMYQLRFLKYIPHAIVQNTQSQLHYAVWWVFAKHLLYFSYCYLKMLFHFQKALGCNSDGYACYSWRTPKGQTFAPGSYQLLIGREYYQCDYTSFFFFLPHRAKSLTMHKSYSSIATYWINIIYTCPGILKQTEYIMQSTDSQFPFLSSYQKVLSFSLPCIVQLM